MTMQAIQEFEKKFIGKNKINFNIGDTIKVHTKIIEGEKERIQVFTGIVIAIKGAGISRTFTVYRCAYGCSMERVFLINSPRITRIEIDRKGKVRRAKLYYLRGKSGKKAKVKEQLFKKAKNKAIGKEETSLQNALKEESALEKDPKGEEASKEPKKEKKAEKKPEKKKEEKTPEAKKEPKAKEEKPKKNPESKKKEEDKPKEE
ncbi:MAG: 50S ribosomal protein L19 [Candidatus Anoxychlamydiales bacterium]|nr:50S ribosomal protein L19 [Candidatus Anoxychlamydiales bacterium]